MKACSHRPGTALTFGTAVVQSPERALALEWFETNGLGDVASGTVAGPNTQRRHGLFLAYGGALARPMLLLAALDVALERDGERFELSTHQFGEALHPQGYRRCAQFSAHPLPEWRFDAGGAALTSRFCMPQGRRCAMTTWSLGAGAGPGQWRLRVRPLFAYREADAVTQANPACRMALHPAPGGWAMRPYDACPEMLLYAPGAETRHEALWYYRFLHARHSGDSPSQEDLFTPCEFVYELAPGRRVALAVALEPLVEDILAVESREVERRIALALPSVERSAAADDLACATERFVVRERAKCARILPALPEGPENDLRSCLIALPGLLLSTRRLDEARQVLQDAMARLLDAPSEAGQDDTPLWFIRAAELYVDHSRDWAFLRESISPACETFAQRYIENKSPFGYRLEPDGLLCSTEEGALTWMNGCLDGRPVTPRAGKPVEVNALWHHALGLLMRWARRREATDRERLYGTLQELCGRSFRHRFWNPAANCLFDVVDPPGARGGADAAVRPNQIFAAALPTDLLERTQATGVMAVVENRLLTPRGVRTLSIEEKAFQSSRGTGAAYHQGGIFPWLLGAYTDALFRVYGRTPRAYSRAEVALQPLLTEHLREGTLGMIAECFEGAAPHAPCGRSGCAAAMGEMTRAWVEIKGRMW